MANSTRRKFIGTAAAMAVTTTVATAMPFSSSTNVMEQQYPVVHHVFFWLKNPDSKADRDLLVAGVKTLSKIETVKGLHVGIVADTEKRDVIDSSWGVSELLFFNDLAGQSVYQTHPIHLAFIEKYSHLWSKVIVYDIAQA
ncbi:Dabb family protein [Pedobacter antarcticus]|uniref:Dabb family protein n=1 Tax=Pedobacter antarcticus TaxID=34086 RepID=UPI000884DEF9|nr:Dabb family protein [Pedobacter antarcticus]SDL75267.1 Tat (twin-arginine translocation) pathway signal sequence [Pedobacter antarcticus]